MRNFAITDGERNDLDYVGFGKLNILKHNNALGHWY